MTDLSVSPTTEFHRPSNTEQRVDALHSIHELKDLTLEELRWIADTGTERFVQDGELIFSQGAPPHHLIFVLAGEVVIKRHTSSPVSVLTGRTGRITGKTPFSRISAWNADGRASSNVWLLELHESLAVVAIHDVGDLVQRQVDPVVGHPALGEIVSPDALASVPGTYLGLPVSSPRRSQR